MVARLHARHAFPDSFHDAGAFMSEKVGEKFIGPLGGFDLIDLGATNAAVVNAHMNLAEGEMRGHFEFGDFERSVGFDEDGGLHEIEALLWFVGIFNFAL